MASTKSMKSTTISLKSIESSGFVDKVVEDKRPNFELFLPNACHRFTCPYDVVVRNEYQRDGYLKTLKSEIKTVIKKGNDARTASKAISAMKQSEFAMPSLQTQYNEGTIIVTAVYDHMNRFVEIYLNKMPQIPRVLMQCIAIATPFYDNLTKISITRCGIDVYTIHELYNLLSKTAVTDVVLDGSPLSQGNYAILLEKPTQVKYLSLARCWVNDKVCMQLTSHLTFLDEVETYLTVLNLASNRISDTGAKYIATALRSNRHLRYINLSDNKLTDDGAFYILDALIEFPLTAEEIERRRLRLMTYENDRLELVQSIIKELEMQVSGSSLDMNETNLSKKQTTKKPKKILTTPTGRKLSPIKLTIPELKHVEDAREFTRKKAEMRAGAEMGPFVDSFSNIVKKNDWMFSRGNFILSYLNLAYNNLTYVSVQKIANVLLYQSIHARSTETGLLKVVIQGNNVPATCPEMVYIQNLLIKNISRFAGNIKSVESRRKSRVAKISMTTNRLEN